MKTRLALSTVAILILAGLAWAQPRDPYASRSVQDIRIVNAGGVVGYQPDIATAQDGIVSDLRPTVSADQRYVQIDCRPSVAVIERIDNFMVVTGGIY